MPTYHELELRDKCIISIWNERGAHLYNGDYIGSDFFASYLDKNPSLPAVFFVSAKPKYERDVFGCDLILNVIQGMLRWACHENGCYADITNEIPSWVHPPMENTMKMVVYENNHRVSTVLYLLEYQGFSLLNETYQDKIVGFFYQDRHYFLEPSDLIHALDVPAKSYTVFDTIGELYSYVEGNDVLSYIGYMTGHKNTDEFAIFLSNLKKTRNISRNPNINEGFLIHALPNEDESDPEEEWYLMFE